MSDRKARRVVAELLTVPWAARGEWIQQMLEIAERRNLSPEALAAETGQQLDNTRTVTIRDGVATIPISGIMFRHANLFAEVSGATSYEVLAQDFAAALEDPQVKAIILDVDSQGGEVFGAAELADMIFNARGVKPVVAFVGGFGASAAYWIPSAADEIVVASTGIVGSLGVAMSVTIPSEEPDENGDRHIEFVSSQTPNKHSDPLSKTGREQRQAIVDQLAGVFVADVARNRGVKEAVVLERYVNQECFVGAEAVRAGLADRVGTYEATHRRLAESVNRGLYQTRRMTAAAERPAASSTLLASMLSSVGLENAVRFVAAVSPQSLSVPPAPAKRPAPVTPAPVAELPKESVMPDPTPAAAPTSGADQLAAFKARLASINNLCAAAGLPEKAVAYVESEMTIEAIATELMAARRTAQPPVPITAGAPDPIARGVRSREAMKPYASLGEQLQDIAAVGGASVVPQGGMAVARERLEQITAAVSGAGATVGSDGGFAIQKDFTTELYGGGFKSGELANRVSRTEIGANADGLEVAYVDETSRVTGSRWGGVQVYRGAEADVATAKKPKIGKWECRLEDIIGLAYVTDRLLMDAPAMGQVFSEAFNDEFGFVIDNEIFRGTGAGQMRGCLGADCAVTVSKESGQASTTVVANNVTKMWARVHPRSKQRGAWFINTDVNPQLINLSITTGVTAQVVFLPPGGLSGQQYGSLFGRPVIEIEHCESLGTKGDICYLDLEMFKVITKGGVQQDESIHVKFTSHERTFRWIARVNGAPKLKSAITPFKGTNTLSPFVFLENR